MRVLFVSLIIVVSSGCTTTRLSLGETTTVSPGWDRLKQAAVDAVKDPNVWAPLGAGAVLQINDLDHKLSKELRTEQPLFGSTEDAKNWSDRFRNWTTIGYVTTGLFAEGPESPGDWMWTKTKLIGSQWLTVQLTEEVYGDLKIRADRERPDKSDNLSFPSGHASRAAIQAELANINIEYLPVSAVSKQRLHWMMNGTAGLTAYARVEAGRHFPSDVLAGYALGHFAGHIAKAFILPDEEQFMILPQVTDDMAGVFISIDF